jgi:hypothetical protein
MATKTHDEPRGVEERRARREVGGNRRTSQLVTFMVFVTWFRLEF